MQEILRIIVAVICSSIIWIGVRSKYYGKIGQTTNLTNPNKMTDEISNTYVSLLHSCIIILATQYNAFILPQIITFVSGGFFIADLFRPHISTLFVAHHLLTLYGLYFIYNKYDNAIYGYMVGEISNVFLYIANVNTCLTGNEIRTLLILDRDTPEVGVKGVEDLIKHKIILNTIVRIFEFIPYVICRGVIPFTLYRVNQDDLPQHFLPSYLIAIYHVTGILWSVNMYKKIKGLCDLYQILCTTFWRDSPKKIDQLIAKLYL